MKILLCAVLLFSVLVLAACVPMPVADTQNQQAKNLATAEALIDAFYSFDEQRLKPFLTDAESSAPALLYYQGWAEGGNYKIVARQACRAESDGVISCAIVVEDDAVLALQIGFNVTDTFTLTFNGSELVSVENGSNDPQIYFDAFNWVRTQMPEVMTGPCQGFFAGGPTPGECAKAMTDGYRKFAASRSTQGDLP